MSNRPMLCGVSTVEVDQSRYDELLHKEATLANIERLYDRLSEYVFRDAVGHLLKSEVKTDEEA